MKKPLREALAKGKVRYVGDPVAYVVAETLTNVAKHAEAHAVTVAVNRNGPRVEVEVRDDGRGGAGRVPGSGLEGLAQRVEALDGTFTIDSPRGGPTTIRAELPCAS